MGSAHLGLETSLSYKSATSEAGRTMPISSCQYTLALQTYLERLGVPVTLRLGRPPEDDLVFASQAETLIVTGGGFSRLLGKLAAKCGANVISVPRK